MGSESLTIHIADRFGHLEIYTAFVLSFPKQSLTSAIALDNNDFLDFLPLVHAPCTEDALSGRQSQNGGQKHPDVVVHHQKHQNVGAAQRKEGADETQAEALETGGDGWRDRGLGNLVRFGRQPVTEAIARLAAGSFDQQMWKYLPKDGESDVGDGNEKDGNKRPKKLAGVWLHA